MNWFFLELTRFFAMGGYAKYVWPAYAVAFVMLWISIYLPWRERKNLFKTLTKKSHAPHS